MSQPVTDPGTDPVVTEPVVTDPAPVADPPYKEQLDQFPESLRPMAEKTFKEWDAKVTKQFEQYAPWKEVIESADPESASNALALARYMEANPQELVDALIKTYGLTVAEAHAVTNQPVTPPDTTPDPDLENLPKSVLDKLAKVDTMEQAITVIAQHLENGAQQSQAQQADQLLTNTLNELKTKHGDFDEDYVLTKIVSGADPEKAVLAFRALVPATAPAATTTAPAVVGGAGGAPVGEVPDVTKLGEKDTRDLVARTLAAAAQQG